MGDWGTLTAKDSRRLLEKDEIVNSVGSNNYNSITADSYRNDNYNSNSDVNTGNSNQINSNDNSNAFYANKYGAYANGAFANSNSLYKNGVSNNLYGNNQNNYGFSNINNNGINNGYGNGNYANSNNVNNGYGNSNYLNVNNANINGNENTNYANNNNAYNGFGNSNYLNINNANNDGYANSNFVKNDNSNNYWSVLVAKAMAAYADTHVADFVLALGDNFYNNGVSSPYDSLWTQVYTNIYNYDSLQIPWYAVFGDHDYGSENGLGSLQAQIDFGEQRYDNRWHAGYCYKQTFSVPDSSTTMDIVFIDTILIAPEETYVTSTTAGVSQQTQQQKIQEQLSCLEYYLASSTASFLVVAGHYPIFSTGKDSPGDMTTLVETLYPILEKYRVDVYLCGHDHLLQHLQYTGGTGSMDFVISGAAGDPDESLASGVTSAADVKFAVATGGFVFTTVTPGEMVMDFVDYTGAVLYTTTRAQTRQLVKSDSNSGSQSETESDSSNPLDSTNNGHGSDKVSEFMSQHSFGEIVSIMLSAQFLMQVVLVATCVCILTLFLRWYRAVSKIISAREQLWLTGLENNAVKHAIPVVKKKSRGKMPPADCESLDGPGEPDNDHTDGTSPVPHGRGPQDVRPHVLGRAATVNKTNGTSAPTCQEKNRRVKSTKQLIAAEESDEERGDEVWRPNAYAMESKYSVQPVMPNQCSLVKKPSVTASGFVRQSPTLQRSGKGGGAPPRRHRSPNRSKVSAEDSLPLK